MKLEKCIFFRPRICYLSHVISKEVVATDGSKIKAVTGAEPRFGFRCVPAIIGGLWTDLYPLCISL